MQSFIELVQSFKGNNGLALSSVDTETSLTYQQLHEKVYAYLSAFSQIKKGDPVVLFDIPNLDWVPIFFAVILKGGIVIPLDKRVSSNFLEDVIVKVKPYVVISNSYTSTTVPVLGVEQLLLKKTTEYVSTLNDYNEVSEVIFTSGTWGLPKGVMLSQKNIMTNAYQILEIYHHKQEDSLLSILPLSHAYQQTAGLIVPLIVGSHIVFLENADSFQILQAIKKYKIRTMLVVPKVLTLVRSSILRNISHTWLRGLFLKVVLVFSYLPFFIRKPSFVFVRNKIGITLENFIVGGALLDKETDDFFQGLGYKVHVGYGLSEASPVVSVSLSKKRNEGNVGKIVKGMQYSLSKDGELIIQGDNIFLGYYPDMNKGREHNTEDVVSIDKKGDITIKGRTKNLIIWPTGDKIFAEDLEFIIQRATGVDEVCIVHKINNGVPAIYCALRSETLLQIESDILHSKLPNGIKIESLKMFSVKDFPYTHTLKPDRRKILQMFTK
jgi:long-chain acyl-CoA synthetase